MLKKLSLVTVTALSLTVISGCQTTSFSKVTDRTSSSTTTDASSLSAIPLPQLLERLTYYDWQLTQIKGVDGKIKPFYHHPPLIMDVNPDHLSFSQACQHYKVFINETYQLPYLYRFSSFKTLLEESCQNVNKSEIQSALERLFRPYGDNDFKFEPLPSSQSRLKIALTIKDSATLIFSGTPKPQQRASGIPITHELLQRYQWRLIRATDPNQKLIDDFHQPDIPITANFSTDKFRQRVGFSVGRHGLGGAYVLSVNQTLLTGSDPVIAISFGERLDSTMLKFGSKALSPSRLTLSEQKQTAASQDTNIISPRYLLTQKVETGETLVWQNEVKKTP